MLLRLLRLVVFAAAPVILIGLASARRRRESPLHQQCQARPHGETERGNAASISSPARTIRRVNTRSASARSGKQWFGATRIASKHIEPAWKPPVSLRGNRSPDFYIESGSPKNPMGAAGAGAGRQRTRHPRHQQSCLDRRLCVRGLHPHAQQRHHGSVQPRQRRYTSKVCKVN